MKITCQSCQAKYTIADEKVAGKTVKIKCKKCGATIVVNGSETGAGAPAAGPVAAPQVAAAAPPGDEDDGEGATRVFAEGSGPGTSEWTVNVTDEDQRTLASPQLVIEYQRGVINDDTYVWKDGMADWAPISNVPELTTLIRLAASAAPARAPAPQPAAGEPPGGLGGTMIMNEGSTPTPLAAAAAPQHVAVATPAPAAARRKAPAGGVDLFAPGQQPDGGAGASASSATTSADRLVGERNENSVLFSISALTASAGASKRGDDPFDLGPAPTRNGGRGGGASVEDIMNLGGGMSQGPVLAPPPLLAPVVEAPPPPPVMAMQQPMGGGMSGVGMAEYPQKKKAPIGLIVGLVVGVLGLGGGAFFALSSGGAKPVGPETTTSATTATAATAATTAAPAQTQAAAPDTAAAVPASTGSPATTADPKPVAAANPGRNDPRPGRPTDTKPADTKPAETKPAETKPAETKPAETKPADTGGGKEFDRGAASSTLGGAAGAAKGCKTADGPTGSGRVKVTFASSGNVTSVTLESGPFAGTPLAGCIISAFRGAHVPAFDGAPVSVGKSFNIN